MGSSAQQGIQLPSDKANDADQHAIDAINKAQTVQESATRANTRLTTAERMVRSIDSYKATKQIVLRFRPGQNALSEDTKHTLDEIAAPLKARHGYVIEVQGFSSGRGQVAIAVSRNMAGPVVRYWVLKHEIPAYRIFVVGMGNAPLDGTARSVTNRASGDRVEISVLMNDLDQVAATSTAK